MSFVICYVDADGNVKYEERDQWESSLRESEDEMHGFQIDDEQSPWELDDETSEWLAKHGDEIKGLEAMSGKGDTPRPIVDRDQFDKNHAAVFGDKPKHVCRKAIKNKDGIDICYHCGEAIVGKR